MKRFFTQIAIFVGILMALAIVFDWMISSGLKKTERGHFHTMNALMNDSINADVIMLGSSRVEYAYNPHIIDSVLDCNSRNLGVSGQPFGVSCLRWQLYNRHNNPPKLIIINCDFIEIAKMVENGYEREQYYPYLFDPLVQPYLKDYGFTWVDKYIPMYRYHGEYKLMFIGLCELFNIYHDHKNNPCKGYIPSYEAWNGEALNDVIKNDELKREPSYHVVSLLDSLLRNAIDDGSKVTFVQAPFYCRLRDNLDDHATRAVYDSLALAYGIPFLDYRYMSICEDSTYFQDGTHLNYLGSGIFTLELAKDIDSLNILDREVQNSIDY